MSTRRILLIDDSRVMHELARVALETAGWQLLSAESGPDGIELAARERPDAIVVDVVMDDMDGPATVRALRERPETQDLPILFLTAREDPDLAAMDVAGVLKKPFQLPALAGDIAAKLGWSG